MIFERLERNEEKMVNDTIEKKDIEESKGKNKKKKIPKEISQEILKKMFQSLLRAIGIMFYFIILNVAYSTMKQERLINDIEIFAGVFLIVGIMFLERAYKRDNGSIAISGIEFLMLSLHSLSIMHVITLFKYDFRFYLLTSSYIFSIYYVLKAIVLYTKGRREYLNSLSDISEIVKKEEPVIKDAKKRKAEEEDKQTNPTKKKRTEEVAEVKNKTTKAKVKMVKKEKVEETPSSTKSKTKKVKEKTEENQTAKKNSKTKKVKEKAKENQTAKKTPKTRSKTKKEERPEESKPPEKKKRGRPKKEVMKND